MAALFADVGPEPQELAIDPVQDSLEVLTLPRVLAVKQLQELWDPGSRVRRETTPLREPAPAPRHPPAWAPHFTIRTNF